MAKQEKDSKPRGRPKKIKSPEELWELFEQYVAEKPKRFLKKGVYNAKESKADYIPVEMPLTWYGFSAWLNRKQIIGDIDDYKSNISGSYDSFSDIIKKIDKEIKAEMLGGATAGVYKENIVARLLGLADKTESKVEQNIKIDFSED